MATPKQEKLIQLISENLRNTDSTKTLGELMLEAGYSKSQSKSPSQIIGSDTVQEGLSDVVEDLELLRKNYLNELKARDIEKEPMRDVVKAIDTFTKNHQLLTGGDTERNTQPLIVEIIGRDENASTNGA